jgi:hypothetical protein
VAGDIVEAFDKLAAALERPREWSCWSKKSPNTSPNSVYPRRIAFSKHSNALNDNVRIFPTWARPELVPGR